MIGTTLSHYEITAKLGEGGMGEVWRATDTSLNREVAVKVLPEEMATDPDRLERFKREAQAIAALNHPNIVTIYSVEEADGVHLLTMELVEGKSLDQLLPAGGFELDRFFALAIQVADALAAPHEKGIVHRDLKPANVMVTGDGRVKVLDFGLAKLAETGDEAEETLLMTQAGMILGTVPYMSPEQVQAQPVDHRSDVFSLGILLYEMATGQRPFQGDNRASVISAVLNGQPPSVTEIRADLPNHLGRIVRRCLEKLPQRRYQSAREVQLELEGLESEARMSTGAAAGEVLAEGTSAPATSVRRSTGAWIGAVAVVGLATALAGWWIGAQSAEPAETWSRFTQLTELEGEETRPTLSPDGGSFAYSSRASGSWDVYVQRVGGRNANRVAAHPERDEMWPAFSPDGRLIAYNESDLDGGIWIVGATGESNRRLTDFGFNPTWSPDGELIAFVSEEAVDVAIRSGQDGSTLWKVSATGGKPVQLGDGDAMQPAWSPSGARIAAWQTEGGQRDIVTVSADGGDRVVLLNDPAMDWSPAWSPDGENLYFASDRGGSMGLWRLAIDEVSGEARGGPEPVVSGLEASISLPAFSADGRFLAFRSQTISENPFAIPFDPATERAGLPRQLLRRTGVLKPLSVSPDGEWMVLFMLGERQEDIVLSRTDGSELRRLTDDLALDRSPLFSPDGTAISFFSNRSGQYAGYSIRPDGSALTLLSDPSLGVVSNPMFEPGGERFVAMVEFGAAPSILASPPWPSTPDSVTQLDGLELPAGELRPNYWSPDGRLISGPVAGARGEVFSGVGVYDVESGQARQLSTDADVWFGPWLPDSERVIFLTRDGELVVIDVETAERRVIPVELPLPPGRFSFAVAPDGTTLYYGGRRVESNIWMVERTPRP